MTTGRYREEVFNVVLAQILDQRGVVTAPEQSLQQIVEGKARRQMPDVIVSFRGLRTVIEGKVDDQVGADQSALKDAHERIDKGIAHIAVAVLYPSVLRKIEFVNLTTALEETTLKIAVVSEAEEIGWVAGDVGYLADLLRRTYDQLVAEDVVTMAAQELDSGVSAFAATAFINKATIQRAAEILGIGEPVKRQKVEELEEEE